MQSFGIIGFVFGMMGMSMGIISYSKIEEIKKEIKTLQDELAKLK